MAEYDPKYNKFLELSGDVRIIPINDEEPKPGEMYVIDADGSPVQVHTECEERYRQLVIQIDLDKQALILWVVSRWKAEVENRPLSNSHRRTLDNTWRQMLRHLEADDRKLLGPPHDELIQDE